MRHAAVAVHHSVFNSFDFAHQVLAVALVNEREIKEKDYLLIETFNKNIKSKEFLRKNEYEIRSGYILNDRLAVVHNCSTEFFRYHGEARVFDPDRRILQEIIPDNKTGGVNQTDLGNRQTNRDSASKLLATLQDNYKETFFDLKSAVYLIYSHNIPCTIPYNECSKVLRRFADSVSNYLYVGFEAVHPDTDVLKAKKNLTHAHIILFSKRQFNKELAKTEDKHSLEYIENSLPDWPELFFLCRRKRYKMRHKCNFERP